MGARNRVQCMSYHEHEQHPATAFEPAGSLPRGTVVATQQPIDDSLKVGWQPMQVRCPSCHGEVQTNLITASTKTTHLCVLYIYIHIHTVYICCLWPCAVLPYCFNYCKNVRHYCPNCGNYVGTYSI
ncbi:lipopolysaccharide-induced tumor necrosis factor-alpha factor homolog [Drosophila guanche]|uniref:Blast:Lipopolysaccharide-induced tumor necrosis factor-alpha factor homolog n=1 Tax=Drosophila guanche TaxID=7266 RepID=A0A3B0J1S4_DROGU|nr:lipopolysaccharide-induced tumor necrosis factor-alpha factor homolog [Drosophila guanche]SPP72862.1 blast:Lipopolysaccharide-induced tumor necrosis factor-alpha factor homolog [Drosophila guanche]